MNRKIVQTEEGFASIWNTSKTDVYVMWAGMILSWMTTYNGLIEKDKNVMGLVIYLFFSCILTRTLYRTANEYVLKTWWHKTSFVAAWFTVVIFSIGVLVAAFS